jgi:hypothetical protein
MARGEHIITGERELCSRAADGLQVTLLWDPAANRVRVAIVDDRLDSTLDLPVAAADAMRAFRHPYAYAAEHGLVDELVARRRAHRERAGLP